MLPKVTTISATIDMMAKNEILTAYRRARRRMLFLDYDGTLVGFKRDPTKARPTKILLACLRSLASDPVNTVVVISGRDHETLGAWLGDVPIGLTAEHGFLLKAPGGPWVQTEAQSTAWKAPVHTIMDRYTRAAKGTWTEEKGNAFAWHCRAVSNAQKAQQLQNALAAELAPLAKRFRLRILNGNRVVDAYPLSFSKGTAAKHWLKAGPYDFVLAAGDDLTDEELFKAMPPSAYTLKIGSGQTGAQHRLPSHTAMIRLLQKLAETM
jgi:trehalose 6-phosphate synthase/phosphatase